MNPVGSIGVLCHWERLPLCGPLPNFDVIHQRFVKSGHYGRLAGMSDIKRIFRFCH